MREIQSYSDYFAFIGAELYNKTIWTEKIVIRQQQSSILTEIEINCIVDLIKKLKKKTAPPR